MNATLCGKHGLQPTLSQAFQPDPATLPTVSRFRHPLMQVAVALALTVGWIYLFISGIEVGNVTTVAVSGLAVLGASFLLAWGAETAEKDVPRAFAIAVLAILAVAPEYAVDALYAWNAGLVGRRRRPVASSRRQKSSPQAGGSLAPVTTRTSRLRT